MLNDWDFIKQNKPVVDKLARLSLELSLGTLINDAWTPGHGKHPEWQLVTVTVMLDHHNVYQGSPLNPVYINWEFIDSAELVNQLLTISVNGLNQLAQQGVVVAVQNLSIENLSMYKVMEFTAKYYDANNHAHPAGEFIGQDGCVKIPFSTPIYQWLFDNQHHII